MAVREGLGDLPIFDTDILPGRQNIMQEEVEEDDYQYITKMYPRSRGKSWNLSRICVTVWNMKEA